MLRWALTLFIHANMTVDAVDDDMTGLTRGDLFRQHRTHTRTCPTRIYNLLGDEVALDLFHVEFWVFPQHLDHCAYTYQERALYIPLLAKLLARLFELGGECLGVVALAHFLQHRSCNLHGIRVLLLLFLLFSLLHRFLPVSTGFGALRSLGGVGIRLGGVSGRFLPVFLGSFLLGKCRLFLFEGGEGVSDRLDSFTAECSPLDHVRARRTLVLKTLPPLLVELAPCFFPFREFFHLILVLIIFLPPEVHVSRLFVLVL
mmetsp:Transcript_33290/g.61891  ORF Transcript_33290/g.61891 Transcript_33290/m.61891 type:complete len:259 (-) Transcript_33290:207-983(-)